MSPTEALPARWFRLSISLRLLFVILGIAAIAFTWLHYERREVHARREAYNRLEKLNSATLWNVRTWNDEPTRPAWLRWITSDDSPGELHVAVVPGETREDFAAVRHFPELRHLGLMRTAKIEPGDIELKNFDRLEHLSLAIKDCPDEALVFLADLPSLSSLDLEHTNLRGTGLKWIRNPEKLKVLTLNLPIEDEALLHIAPLKNLETLELDGARITDEGLAHLGELQQLKHLQLKQTRVTGAGLRKLHTPRLERLDLRGCGKFRDEDVAVLADLPLTELMLGPYITDEAIPDLQAISTLKVLILDQTHLSKAGLERLRDSLPNARIAQTEPPSPFPP